MNVPILKIYRPYRTLANRGTCFSANIQSRRDNILVESKIHVRIKSHRDDIKISLT